MALHFTRAELAERRQRACERLAELGLDGILLFRQESMFYLTGYDTEGFVLFQGMYLGADGSLALLTRLPDKRQSAFTSVLEDVRIWRDRAGATPADELRDMLESYGCRGKRLGIEYAAFGLTGERALMVNAAMDGFCTLVDASDLVRLLRLVKSPAEIEYVRRSGQLCDEARDVCIRSSVAGASVSAVYGEMLSTMMRGGGDPTANRWVVGAGEAAMLGRYHAGLGTIGENDQATWEYGASYRHYHTGLMHMVLTGKPTPRQTEMFAACVAALDACGETTKPGNTVGQIYDAHARAMTDRGFADTIMNASGYTMGVSYPPTWMDEPMIYMGNPQVLAPNMVFFLIMVVYDDTSGEAMSLAETVVVTEDGCDAVCHAPRELVVNT